MKDTGIYRIVIVSLLIGFVAVNVLFGLFYYIDRLVNKKTRLVSLQILSSVLLYIQEKGKKRKTL